MVVEGVTGVQVSGRVVTTYLLSSFARVLLPAPVGWLTGDDQLWFPTRIKLGKVLEVSKPLLISLNPPRVSPNLTPTTFSLFFLLPVAVRTDNLPVLIQRLNQLTAAFA